MSSTVSLGGLEISSNTRSASEMVASLTPQEGSDVPKIIQDRGEKVEGPEKSPLSKAASELGKKGAEARKAKQSEKQEAPVEETTEAEPARTADVGSESEGAAEPESSAPAEKPLGKPRNDPRARIQQLANERNEWRRKAEEAEQRLASGQQPKAEPQPAEATGRPRMRDFEAKLKPGQAYSDAVESYTAAVVDYERAQAQQRDQIMRQVDSFASQVRTTTEAFAKQIQTAGADFHTKIDPSLTDLRATFQLQPNERPTSENFLADEIVSSENAPGLLLHFTEHMDDFKRIAALQSPRQIAIAVAKIEARLEAAATPRPSAKTTISQARPPVKPVAGSPPLAEPDMMKPMDFNAYAAANSKRLHARRR